MISPVWLALLFLLGTALGIHTDLPVPAIRWLAVVTVLLAPHALGRRVMVSRLVLATAVLSATFFLGARARVPRVGHDRARNCMEVEATVSDVPVVRRDGPNHRRRSSSYFSTVNPQLRVRVDGRLDAIQPGHRLRMRGHLVFPGGARNPGDPSPIDNTPRFYVATPELTEVLDYIPFSLRTKTPVSDSILGFITTIRDAVHRQLGSLYASHGELSRGTVLALLIGDRRLLDQDLKDSLRRTGTAHFLAISGVHIGLLFAWLSRVPLPRRCGAFVRLALLFLFTLTAGAAPPVLRAALMLSLPCLADALGRRMRSMDALSWAIIILVAIDPASVRSLGFQLSAIAVFSILAWKNSFEACLSRGASWIFPSLRRSLAVSAAASVGTAPLIAYHFQSLHPLGIFWSVLLFPVVALVLLGAALSLLAGSVHSLLAAPITWLTSSAVQALSFLAELMAQVPGSHLQVLPPPAALVIAVTAAQLLSWLFWKKLGGRTVFITTLGGLLAVAGVFLVSHHIESSGREDEAWFFDVGAGSAQLLRASSGESVLVDVGSSDRSHGLGRRLARTLLTLGVSRLDAVILTHKDADHVNGALDLLDLVPARRVFVTDYFEKFPAGRLLAEALRTRGIVVQKIRRGDRISGPTWNLDVVYPAANETLPFIRHSNESSLVLKFTVKDRSILLTADIEEAGTARLLSMDDNLKCDVLVYPHHGRRNELMDEILGRVKPTWIVLSASHDASALETARRLESRDLWVHATWRDRAGRAVLRDGRWIVEAWKP